MFEVNFFAYKLLSKMNRDHLSDWSSNINDLQKFELKFKSFETTFVNKVIERNDFNTKFINVDNSLKRRLKLIYFSRHSDKIFDGGCFRI